MKKIAVIGLFRTGQEAAEGQSVKTRIVTNEVEKRFGINNVCRIDTFQWKKHPFDLAFRCICAVFFSKDVIFMTDAGGIKIFPWLLTISNLFGKCKIHYVVIGGWLIRSLDDKFLRRYWLKKLGGIYVETSTMKTALEKKGFTNIYLLPNCKRLDIVEEKELFYCEKEPHRLCTFSRVMKEKGIQDAVEAVKEVNRRLGRQVYTLDIYGQVDVSQQEWFNELKASFSESIRYCGTIPYDQSTDILREYYALLFPTRFYTEGVPGTIIDAFASGIPVIASRWESYDDILDDETCISYAFKDAKGLSKTLEEVAENPNVLYSMKTTCLQRAKMYDPGLVMKTLFSEMNTEDIEERKKPLSKAIE